MRRSRSSAAATPRSSQVPPDVTLPGLDFPVHLTKSDHKRLNGTCHISHLITRADTEYASLKENLKRSFADKGNQLGLSINQKSSDALASWSSVFWSFGASTVAADSKTVTINSPESRQALEYAVGLYNMAMTPEVRRFFFAPSPLIITKANVVSKVHRRAHMDYIGIKTYRADGTPKGEIRVGKL
jgi:hypothetical protein